MNKESLFNVNEIPLSPGQGKVFRNAGSVEGSTSYVRGCGSAIQAGDLARHEIRDTQLRNSIGL